LFIIIFPVLVKDSKIVKKRQKIARLLIGEFKKKTTLLVSIFTPIVGINIGLTGVVIPLYLNIFLDINLAEIGYISTIMFTTRVIGSLICGGICDRVGRKIVLYIVGIGGCFFTAILVFADSWITVVVLYTIIGFFHGGQYSALGAMLMDVTNPKVGATQYSILTSLGNVGMTFGESYSGTMIAVLGFSRTFLYGAWVFGPAFLILYFIKLKIQSVKEKT
jgi:MFS family permease